MKFACCIFQVKPFGGLQRSFLAMAKACVQAGHQVDVYTMAWQGEVPAGLQVQIIPASGWTNHQRCATFVNQLAVTLKKHRYDRVIGFNRMPGLDVYYAGDVCFADEMSHKNPLLTLLSARYRTYLSFERAVMQSQAQLLWISEKQRDTYLQHYQIPENRQHMLPPGIRQDLTPPIDADMQVAAQREIFAIPASHAVLLMLGSDFKRKGVDRAIRAIASLPAEMPTTLLIVGEGKTDAMLSLAKQLGVADCIRFLGPRQDTPVLYCLADGLLHPALAEAGGNVVLEALASGTPVLTTAACGFASHVKRANAGMVLAEPFHQVSWNAAVLEFLSSDQRQSWCENSLYYAATEDLYSRAEAALTLFEAC